MAISSGRRTFFLGVNTGYVTNGLPDGRYVDFYSQRSSPDLHCAIIGNVVVPGGHGSNQVTPTLSRDAIWAKIAGAIANKGSVPGIQLATSWEGYAATRKFVGQDPAGVIAAARMLVRELGTVGAQSIISAFSDAASMAVDHGYRHVQLHCAHGYLLSLLIDERINERSEQVLSLLARLSERLGASGIETSIRISMVTGYQPFDAVGTSEFQDRIAGLPFDYVDLSAGFYNIDKRLIYPSRPDTIQLRHAMSREVARRHPNRWFIVSGRALEAGLKDLPENAHVGLCRDLIANPNYLAQPRQGCENKNKCHYFSRGGSSLRCGLWKEEDQASLVA